MLQSLVDWMDDNFGHDLTDIVINVTMISRGVDAAFNHPRLRQYSYLNAPIKLLLQTGFAREYRHATWGQIIQNRGYAHVVNQFMEASLNHLPEAQAAISIALRHIQEERA